jgi:hypothetical protein
MPPNLDQGNRAPSARNRHLPFAEIAGVANSVLHRRAARLRVPFWNAGRRPRRECWRTDVADGDVIRKLGRSRSVVGVVRLAITERGRTMIVR